MYSGLIKSVYCYILIVVLEKLKVGISKQVDLRRASLRIWQHFNKSLKVIRGKNHIDSPERDNFRWNASFLSSSVMILELILTMCPWLGGSKGNSVTEWKLRTVRIIENTEEGEFRIIDKNSLFKLLFSGW